MDKLVAIKDSEFEVPCWITSIGNHNKLPEPYREIDLDEFTHLFGTYVQQYKEYRSIVLPGGKFYQGCHLLWYPNYALMMVPPVEWHHDRERNRIAYDQPWRYFKIGCDHEPTAGEPSPYRCYHNYVCSKCGYRWSVDSSD